MNLPDDRRNNDTLNPRCARRRCRHRLDAHFNGTLEDWHCVDCPCKEYGLTVRENLRHWAGFPRFVAEELWREVRRPSFWKKLVFALASYVVLVALPATLFGYLLVWVGVPQLGASLGQLAMTVFLFLTMGRILQYIEYLVKYQKEYAKEVDQPDDV